MSTPVLRRARTIADELHRGGTLTLHPDAWRLRRMGLYGLGAPECIDTASADEALRIHRAERALQRLAA